MNKTYTCRCGRWVWHSISKRWSDCGQNYEAFFREKGGLQKCMGCCEELPEDPTGTVKVWEVKIAEAVGGWVRCGDSKEIEEYVAELEIGDGLEIRAVETTLGELDDLPEHEGW